MTRDSEFPNMQMQRKMLESLLDSMESYIYTSDLYTDEILFVNKKMAQDFNLGKGKGVEKCWQRLQSGQTGRCAWCKKSALIDNPSLRVSWEDENPITGSCILKSDRVIDWPDGRKVHMQEGVDITVMKRTEEALKRRETSLDALNRAATLILSREDDDYIEAITHGIEIISRATGFDRMSVFRNHATPDGVLRITQIYRWSRVHGGTTETIGELRDVPFSALSSGWEGILAAGDCVNGPVSRLHGTDTAALLRFGCVSILAVPVLNDEVFWGFTCFEDLSTERVFDEYETDMLRSASFMLANVVMRNEEKKNAQMADEYAKLLLDATPMSCRLWSRDYELLECNEASVLMFGLQNKQEYIDRFYELLPKFQSNGLESRAMIKSMVDDAFLNGFHTVDNWVYRLPDTTDLPTELTLIRIPYKDDFVVASYSRDLREQRRMMDEIGEALTVARKANNAKSDFLTRMSHEIRTPLNTIIGLSELSMSGGEESGNYLLKICEAGTTILSIVNDILDISKIESEKLALTSISYDTPSLINDVITQNIVLIGEKQLEFRLSVDGDFPGTLFGDELRVKQIFGNILSNAFKYTQSGVIEWALTHERIGNDIWIGSDVRDTGIGLKPEDMEKLFSDYGQIDSISNRSVGGTGLGLAIARRLSEMMGGKVTAESEYGSGSVFHTRLRQGFVSDTTIGEEVAKNLKSLRYEMTKRDKSAKRSKINLSYARVLIVDDISTNLDVVKGMLKPYEIKTDCVNSGYKAVEAIQAGKHVYDAIFMDHMMPGMDGVEAAKLIRETDTEYARNIPIIALTANAIVGNEKMFLENGFQAFIPKPIDMAKLDSVLRRFVRNKSLEISSEITTSKDVSGSWDGHGGIFIDGIDTDAALTRFGQDASVLCDVLRSYMNSIPGLLDSMDEFLASGEMDEYAIIAHGIKGSSRGISADEVGETAEALEHAAKERKNEFVEKIHPGFRDTVFALVGRISETLDRMNAEKFVRTKKEPDCELLVELREACGSFDMDRVDRIMSTLESYKYESGNEIVVWLREKVNNTEFLEISNDKW